MKSLSNHRRWLAGLLFAVMATTLVAPLAEAGHRKWRRYRGPTYETRVVREVYRSGHGHAHHGTYTVWRSNAGPAIAGFVGGLFLGATLAHAAPAGYVYWDSYCHRSFASLDAYDSHSGRYHHTRTVRVIEIPNGYDWDDYHYCDDCDDHYWGDGHDCD